MENDYYEYTKDIRDISIRLNEDEFDSYLRTELGNYIKKFDLNTLDDRHKISSCLSHLSLLYLNIILNGRNMYLLGEKEEKLSQKGREIICDILDEIRNNNSIKI